MQTNFLSRLGLAVMLLIISATACMKKEISVVSVPTITGVNKYLIHAGDTLVITGSGFSTQAADNQVAIATSSLVVTRASAGQLSAIVQTGTQSGQLTVSLPGSKSAIFDSTIQIIGATQPYVTSITPSSAYAGDTVVIRGGNFGVPGSTNDVVVSGVTYNLYNATDSLLRVVLPDNAHSGPLTVTTNGVTSPAVNFIVRKFNPLTDGRLYWVYASTAYNDNSTQIYRGADSSIGFPYGSVVYSNSTVNEFSAPYQQMELGAGIEPMLSDAQGNAYFLNTIFDQFGGETGEAQVMKLTFDGHAVTRTIIQDQTWSGTTALPGNFPYPVFVSNQPDLLTIDGNTLYEHIGLTNTWYTADLTLAAPTFVQQNGILNDSMGFGMKMTPNYIFYDKGSSNNNYSMNLITEVRYLHRGSDTTTKVISIPMGESVQMTLSAPGHGDNILVFTETNATANLKIYKFDPSTAKLQLLYSPANWEDAAQSSYGFLSAGFLWAGSHIYYADARHSPLNLYGQQSYTSLYVLNDDGSSTHGINVYPRLEPIDAQNAAPYFPLFAAKQ